MHTFQAVHYSVPSGFMACTPSNANTALLAKQCLVYCDDSTNYTSVKHYQSSAWAQVAFKACITAANKFAVSKVQQRKQR